MAHSSRRFYKTLGFLVLAIGYIPTFSQLLKNTPKCETVEHCNEKTFSVADLIERTDGLLSFFKKDSTDEHTNGNANEDLLCANILSLCIESFDHPCSNVARKTTSDKQKTLLAQNSIATIKSGKFAGCRVAKGTVHSNFYIEAMRLGVPANVINAMVKNLSGKINFRRSLKVGNTFEVVFDGKKMLYCHFEAGKHNKTKASVYGIEEANKMIYCFEDGVKVAQPSSKSFGRPLAGSMKISSPYGMRVHPIKGVRCYHSGVDLSAKYGSPIYAISDGVVMRASKYAGYGNCVEIAHASGYKSLYGHLSRYAVRCGTRVRKGQVIGYIGSTGLSTGPHLHLELARYNKTMNPFSIKMLPSESKKIKNIRLFQTYKNQIKNAISKQH